MWLNTAPQREGFMRPLIHKLIILISLPKIYTNRKYTMEREDMKIEHRIPVEPHFCIVIQIEVNHLALWLESLVFLDSTESFTYFVYSYPAIRKKEIP